VIRRSLIPAPPIVSNVNFSRGASTVAGTLAAATVALGIASLAGWSIWPVVSVVFLTWLVALSTRAGYLIATSAAVVVVFGSLLGGLILCALLRGPIVLVVTSTVVVVGGLGCVLLARSWLPALRRPPSVWRDLVGSLLGLAVWIAALIVSLRLPVAERLGWMMRGDSMNNLIFTHVDLRAHGILLHGNLNPTPLPAGLVTLGLIPGRVAGPVQLNLAHDLASMAVVWFGLIALTTVLCGLVSSAIVTAAIGHGWRSALAGAGGSVLVLSWYVTGQPLEFGFLNLDVVLPILLACLLLTLGADRTPWAVVAGLGLGSTLVMSVWTPLVVIPLALLLVTLIRHRRSLLVVGARRWAVIALSAAQFVAYALIGALPAFFEQQAALRAQGGIYSPSKYAVFVLGAVVVGLAVLVFRRMFAPLFAIVTVVIAAWIALGALLVLSHGVFTYYPLKLTLFANVVFLVLGFALGCAFVARLAGRRILQRLGTAVLALALALLLVVTPRLGIPSSQYNPVVRLTVSHPDEVIRSADDTVLRLASRAKPTILWGTGQGVEAPVDLWLLQLHADTLSGTSALRLVAYAQEADHSTVELCRIARMVGPGLVVSTTSAELRSALARSCPRVRLTIDVTPMPTR
jgi:hypothetical protein